MKLRSTAKMAIGFLAILMSGGLVLAQGAAPNQLPYGSEKAKQDWIQANPSAYKAMGGQTQVSTEAVQQSQMTEKQKLQWIAKNPSEYKKLNGNAATVDYSTYPDYPKYVDTGNPEKDMLKYGNSKLAFCLAHGLVADKAETPKPSYVNTGNEKADLARYNDAKAAYKKANGEVVVVPPVYVNTGNPAADLVKYNEAKQAFKVATGDPEATRPVFKNTGNPEADLARYNNAKASFNAAQNLQNN